MITLLQLMKLMNKEVLESWCESIKFDQDEAYELALMLDHQAGIELTDSQIKALIRICENNSYKAALKMEA